MTVLRETRNTVCGRHPIGVVMAALELLMEGEGGGGGKTGTGTGAEDGAGAGNENERKSRFHFRFVRYERSSDCVRVGDSSVSYASAFAVL